MTRIMTGPMGRMAYFDVRCTRMTEYPALNLPSTSFARATDAVASNCARAPGVVQFPRHQRRDAAVALLGEPSRRTPFLGEH